MVVWRLITHHKDPEALLSWAKSNGRIAVGWTGLMDLRRFDSTKQIAQAARASGHGNWSTSGVQLKAFRDEMSPGDLVILSTGRRRALVMRIDGDYEYVGLKDDNVAYSHQRLASVVESLRPEDIWRAAGGPGGGQNGRWTVMRCRYEVDGEGIRIQPADE